jgi:fibronectin-binding autotransporter adhesin
VSRREFIVNLPPKGRAVHSRVFIMHNASLCRGVRSNRTRLILVGAFLPLVMPLSAHAATEFWKIGSGNWNVAANWSNAANLSTAGAVPVGGDTANIWNNDATSRTITLNTNVATAVAALNLANIGTGTSTFAQGNFNFAAVNESVGGSGNGNNARGAYTQSGGTNSVSGFLAVGDVAGSTGAYTMTGGALTTGATMIVGASGTGVFNQTAGTTVVGTSLQIAAATGSNGTVTIGPAAQLSVNGDTRIGGTPNSPAGTGSITVQGVATFHDLYLNSTGTLNLVSGGTMNVNNFFRFVGGFGWTGGTLNIAALNIDNSTGPGQSSGGGPLGSNYTIDAGKTLNVANDLNVGWASGHTGTLSQTGGVVTVGTVASPHTLRIGLLGGNSGGTLNVSGAANLTVNGTAELNTGTLNVSGGTMTVSQAFAVQSLGNLNVSGGSLSVANKVIANKLINQSGGSLSAGGGLSMPAGGFMQTGGTTTIGTELGASGGANVTVNGSTANIVVNGGAYIGGTSTSQISHATLSIPNGAMSTTQGLSVYSNSNAGLSGGSLSVGGKLQLFGPLAQSGGMLTVANGARFSGVAFDQSAGNATLSNNVDVQDGGQIKLSGTAQLTSNGQASIGTSAVAAGLNIAGGSMTVNNLLLVDVKGTTNLSGGTLTASTLTSAGQITQTGGALTAGTTANNGGKFTQSAGTATFATEFGVRNFGTLAVSGTSVFKVNGNAYVGGSSAGAGGPATATLTGGTTTVTSQLKAYTGAVNLSAGALSVGSLQLDGDSTFTQTGGTFTAPSINATGTAALTFNGGTATVTGGAVSIASGATLSGVATINSPATINGSLKPGTDAAVGIINLSGADTFGATSKTRIRIAGFALTDHVNTGSVTLGGTLQLSMLNAYVPVYGNSYVVMIGNPIQGKFSKVTGNQLADRWLAVTYSSNHVSIAAAFGGDANLDGAVDFNDLVTLAQHYDLTTGQTWSTGDFNGTGGVDFNDLVVLAQSYNQTTSGAMTLPANFAADWALAQSLVPEPTSMLLLAMAAHGLTRRRRPM